MTRQKVALLQGQRFDMLVIVRELNERQHGMCVWEARCDCGNLVKVTIGRLSLALSLVIDVVLVVLCWTGRIKL